jgi:hypothetical protein
MDVNLGEIERGPLSTPRLQLLLSLLKLDDGARIVKESNSNPLTHVTSHRLCSCCNIKLFGSKDCIPSWRRRPQIYRWAARAL